MHRWAEHHAVVNFDKRATLKGSALATIPVTLPLFPTSTAGKWRNSETATSRVQSFLPPARTPSSHAAFWDVFEIRGF